MKKLIFTLATALTLASANVLAADIDDSTVQAVDEGEAPETLALPSEAAETEAADAAAFGLDTANDARDMLGEGARDNIEAFRDNVQEGAAEQGRGQ